MCLALLSWFSEYQRAQVRKQSTWTALLSAARSKDDRGSILAVKVSELLCKVLHQPRTQFGSICDRVESFNAIKLRFLYRQWSKVLIVHNRVFIRLGAWKLHGCSLSIFSRVFRYSKFMPQPQNIVDPTEVSAYSFVKIVQEQTELLWIVHHMSSAANWCMAIYVLLDDHVQCLDRHRITLLALRPLRW